MEENAENDDTVEESSRFPVLKRAFLVVGLLLTAPTIWLISIGALNLDPNKFSAVSTVFPNMHTLFSN